MSKRTSTILLTALLSSAIFIFIISTGLDIILMFLSTIPLFSVGLSKDPKIVLQAGALATIPIALFTMSLFPVTLYFLIFALPCWYICHMAQNYYDIKLSPTLPLMRLWHPVGLITVYLALYGCILLAIITAVFATQEVNWPAFLMHITNNTIEVLNKEYDISIETSPKYIALILCGSIVWLWCSFMMGYAWFINYTLVKKNLAKRPNFMITPFPMPHWLLTLIGICALASLIGGESMSFLGKATLIILMIPYFFQGSAILYTSTRKWANKPFFIFIFYIFTIISFWPAMLIAGIGLWNHIKIFNKHLSSDGSSSRS
jgi:hypothetical protein